MARVLFILSGALGFLAVALGAFGAHGLQSRLALVPDGEKRLAWWTTAAEYNLTHALAVAVAAWLVSRGVGLVGSIAGLSFTLGVVLFSGSLYWMAVTGQSRLAIVTPFGGGFLLIGWVCVVIAGVRLAD